MREKVLITGASGFVGANLLRRMLSLNHNVSILLREESKLWRIEDLINDVDTRYIDLLDYEKLKTTVDEIKPDWIFHLAVNGAYSWQTDWAQIVNTNVLSTINLVEACSKNGFQCFVNTGSSSEYGFYDHAPREEEPVKPNSYYSVTKACATMACQYIAEREGLRIPTLRLYSVYGPYEDPKRLMPTLIRKGLRGELPPLVDPSIARDYIYVDDVVDAYLKVVGSKSYELGSIFNVGTAEQTSIEEIVKIARAQLGIKCEPSWGSMENRNWDSSVWVSDNQKLVNKLDWKPNYGIEDGFSKFVEWVTKTAQEPFGENYQNCGITTKA